MTLSSAKKLAGVLLAGFLSACSTTMSTGGDGPVTSGLPGNRISSLFNHQAAGHIYNLPCHRRDAERAGNIREPYHEGTPSYFEKDDHKVALYSRHLSIKDKETARDLVRGLPPYVMDLVYAPGAVFVFTAHSLTEVAPYYARLEDKHGNHPFEDRFAGMYVSPERRIYMTFYTVGSDKNSEENARSVRSYRPLYNKENVFHHEIGHYIDDLLGEGGYISAHPDFIKKFQEDLQSLVKSVPPGQEHTLKSISYFLPKTFQNRTLPGQHDSLGSVRGEVFAELWSEVQGYNGYGLAHFFPQTFKFIEDMDFKLQTLYQMKGRHCGFDEQDVYFDFPLWRL